MLYTNYTNYPTADKSFDFYSLYSIQLSACSLSIVALECFKLFFKLLHICIYQLYSSCSYMHACPNACTRSFCVFKKSSVVAAPNPKMEAVHEYASFCSSLYSTAGGISQRTKELFIVVRVVWLKLFLCYFLLLVLCFFFSCIFHLLCRSYIVFLQKRSFMASSYDTAIHSLSRGSTRWPHRDTKVPHS